ncbi:MAG: hypothetical protein WA981_00930 [Glaciecola sp.]
MKTCTRCNITKQLDDFHNCKSKKSGKFSQCKECRNDHNRRKANEIGHDVLYARALANNPDKYKTNQKKYYKENKDKVVKNVAEWRKRNPDARKKEYLKAKDKKIAYAKEWAENNPEKRRAIASAYSKRFRADPENKPYQICRKLLARVIGLKEGGKTGKTETMLGYTRHELKYHIGAMFQDGMSWGNHGDWHIDHIKPVSAFIKEGETDPKVINALDNLQPLWARDNLSKGAKYEP